MLVGFFVWFGFFLFICDINIPEKRKIKLQGGVRGDRIAEVLPVLYQTGYVKLLCFSTSR